MIVYLGRRNRHEDKSNALELALKHLRDEAIYFRPGRCAWSTPAYSFYRTNHSEIDGYQFNLGLAHGVPCITASIVGALEQGYKSELALELVHDSSHWITEQAIDAPLGQGCYPSYSGGNAASRLGWCYGDLTLAITLERSARILGCETLHKVASELAVAAATRDPASSGVEDASLCHGSCGLFLGFSILSHFVTDGRIREAADYWLDVTFDRYRSHGLEGFNFVRGSRASQNRGLLEGYAGIGLVLVSALREQSDWSDCLLLPTS